MNSKRNINKFIKVLVLLVILIVPIFQMQIPIQLAQAATQEELEGQLKDIESQIAVLQQQLNSATSEKNTIAGKVKQLKNQQAQINLEIQSTNYLISDLDDKITQTSGSIDQSEARIENLKSDIARTLLELYQRDNSSLLESMATDQGLSGFFNEVDNFEALSKGLRATLAEVRNLKADLENQQIELSDQQQSAEGLLALRAVQQRDLSGKLLDQSSLLQESQGKEAQVTVVLNYNKQVASQIRGQIYQLLGVTTEVTFGQALDIANAVAASTGIRAAFLLAVLTQESNLGKNVGTCNRAGDPEKKSWRSIMKPDRDQEPFKTITTELGLDIETTPVSCPMYDKKGARVGWGGAMGPAQFIPSTWMGYKDKVTAYTGKPANPWDIRDAFYAAGIKLIAGGAGSNGEKGEWDAAMRYFSGSTSTKYRFYGDSVLATARKYQTDITSLAN